MPYILETTITWHCTTGCFLCLSGGTSSSYTSWLWVSTRKYEVLEGIQISFSKFRMHFFNYFANCKVVFCFPDFWSTCEVHYIIVAKWMGANYRVPPLPLCAPWTFASWFHPSLGSGLTFPTHKNVTDNGLTSYPNIFGLQHIFSSALINNVK